MDKVFRTGNQWFIGVWKDSKKTQVRLEENTFTFYLKRKDVFSAMILCV